MYDIYPGLESSQPAIQARCDMDTDGGGWTVIQRRADILLQDTPPTRQNFYLDWESYKQGFGSLTGEFWWGFTNIRAMTTTQGRMFEMRVDVKTFRNQTLHAVYAGFRISSEDDHYRLMFTNFSGSYLADALSELSLNKPFSTIDRDQTSEGRSFSCVQFLQGPWWYAPPPSPRGCANSDLNGPYQTQVDSDAGAIGIIWGTPSNGLSSVKEADMKIRPM